MSEQQASDVLDHISQKPMPAFAQVMPRVAEEYGKSLGGQLKDLLAYCIRGNKLTVDEYYHLRLFDDATYSREEKKRVVGITGSNRIWSAVNEVNPWAGFMLDKLAGEILLRGMKQPVTETVAISGGTYPDGDFKRIADLDDLKAFLGSASFPLFGKPVTSLQSLGSARFEAYDKASGTLKLSNGGQVTVENLWSEIEGHFNGKYLFQRCIEAHSVLREICKSGLPTIRVVTVDRGNGPELYRCVIKLTGGANVADNFWRQGNLIAPVDNESGQMGEAVTGMGIDGVYVESHPDTGKPIKGVTVPHWNEVCKAALAVAGFYKDAMLIGFDIAVTESGPVIVEVNNGPELTMLQLSHRKGVLDQPMMDMMEHVRNLKEGVQNELRRKVAEAKQAEKKAFKVATGRKAA